jgi:hypothetical protein
MSYQKLFYLFTIFLFIKGNLLGQLGEKREKFPIHFGLQTRVVIPSNFLGAVETNLSDQGFSSSLKQKLGFSYGALVRADFTKNITIEGGINFIQRHFNASMTYTDSIEFIKDTNRLTFINYELPLTGIVKIQLGKSIFSMVGLGPAFTFKPTSVKLIDQPGGKHTFYHTGSVKKFGIDLNAQIGFEYRTKKSGFYYFGGSAKIPTSYLFNWGGKYSQQGSSNYLIDFAKVNGAFLSLDLRYYFPKIRNSGVQFKPGPIE